MEYVCSVTNLQRRYITVEVCESRWLPWIFCNMTLLTCWIEGRLVRSITPRVGVNKWKKWSHLKILDTRRVTRSKFHTWGRSVQTLDATVTGRPPFVYCRLTNWHSAANQASVVHLLVSHCTDCDISFPGPGFSQLFEAWSCVNTYKFGCSWQEQHSLNSTKCSYVVGAV
jgi:hypothetical protein